MSDSKSLSFQFDEVRYGLLHFSLKLGDEIFSTRFSNAFDPILRLKHWLEAVAIGVEQCSFSYDPEGNDTRFNFRQVTYDRCEFVVGHADADHDESPFLMVEVDRSHLVRCIYQGFLDLDASPAFDRFEWEAEPYWSIIRSETGLELNEIVDRVIHLPRSELILLNARLDKVAEPSKFSIVKGGADFDSLLSCAFPFYWSTPRDYDSLPLFEKRAALIASLSSTQERDLSGTSLGNLRSTLIDLFLANGR